MITTPLLYGVLHLKNINSYLKQFEIDYQNAIGNLKAALVLARDNHPDSKGTQYLEEVERTLNDSEDSWSEYLKMVEETFTPDDDFEDEIDGDDTVEDEDWTDDLDCDCGECMGYEGPDLD